MGIRLDAGLYRKFCVVAAVAIFFTNFSNYTERLGFIPLYWVGIFAALTAPLFVGAITSSRLTIRPLTVWCACFLMISILWYFPSRQDAAAYQEVQTRVLSVIFVLMMFFLFGRPDEQRLARVMVVLAVLLGVGFNIYELFHPMTFSKIPGRSSGLFENSNQSGSGLMLGMILGYAVVPRSLKIPFVALTGVGILTTFTRSAMLGWIAVVILLTLRSGFGFRQMRNVLVICTLALAFVSSPYWGQLQTTLEEKGAVNIDLIQRIAFFSTGSAADDSANERKQVAEAAWRLFEEKPYAGYGTGYSRNIEGFAVSTHDIHLANMLDHGFLGLFIMPSLLLVTVWGKFRNQFDVVGPFVLFMLMWGLFSHNILEERYILLAVALVASLAPASRTVPAEVPAVARVRVPAGAVVGA